MPKLLDGVCSMCKGPWELCGCGGKKLLRLHYSSDEEFVPDNFDPTTTVIVTNTPRKRKVRVHLDDLFSTEDDRIDIAAIEKRRILREAKEEEKKQTKRRKETEACAERQALLAHMAA